MGSPLRLTVAVVRGAEKRAGRAWREVRDEFACADAALSGFRSDSALTALNRRAAANELRPIDSRLYRALCAAAVATRMTRGRFDPTILGDLERLGWPGIHIGQTSGPSTAPPDRSGAWLVRCPRSRSARLLRPIDLGGIGKGLALRWAFCRLIRALAGGRPWGALLEAGGDILTTGVAPDGGRWRIAIENPAEGTEPIAVLSVEAAAVCTSSVLIGRWRDPAGRWVHHLIDPRTGEPAAGGLRSVTVSSSDAAWAEVWSKALFVAGAGEIARLARAQRLAAWWTTTEGRLLMTPSARAVTVWARSEYAEQRSSGNTNSA
jgi:FAD:protein FMN transferase